MTKFTKIKKLTKNLNNTDFNYLLSYLQQKNKNRFELEQLKEKLKTLKKSIKNRTQKRLLNTLIKKCDTVTSVASFKKYLKNTYNTTCGREVDFTFKQLYNDLILEVLPLL